MNESRRDHQAQSDPRQGKELSGERRKLQFARRRREPQVNDRCISDQQKKPK